MKFEWRNFSPVSCSFSVHDVGERVASKCVIQIISELLCEVVPLPESEIVSMIGEKCSNPMIR